MPYRIEKEGAMHYVVSNHTGLRQFSSLKRSNCRHWIQDNTQTETADEYEEEEA